MIAKLRSPAKSARRVAESPEYFLFENCINIFFKICRNGLRRRIIKRYEHEIKIAFANLRNKAKEEFENFSTPGEKMEFVREIHKKAPAYRLFYFLEI